MTNEIRFECVWVYHHFDQECIKSYFAARQQKATCPLCCGRITKYEPDAQFAEAVAVIERLKKRKLKKKIDPVQRTIKIGKLLYEGETATALSANCAKKFEENIMEEVLPFIIFRLNR